MPAKLPLLDAGGASGQATVYSQDPQIDALGPQRVAEVQLMSERRIRDLEAQLADLESQRHRLEAGLLNLEHDGALPALSEQERISQYQQAEVETKKLEARLRGELAAKKALLENERDRKIAALQIEHERSQARANSEAAAAIRASLAKDLSRAKEESRKAVLKIETEGAA